MHGAFSFNGLVQGQVDLSLVVPLRLELLLLQLLVFGRIFHDHFRIQIGRIQNMILKNVLLAVVCPSPMSMRSIGLSAEITTSGISL